jgi:hypothetical protein
MNLYHQTTLYYEQFCITDNSISLKILCHQQFISPEILYHQQIYITNKSIYRRQSKTVVSGQGTTKSEMFLVSGPL